MSYRDSIALFCLMQPVHRRTDEGISAGAVARTTSNVIALPLPRTQARPAPASCFGPGTVIATPAGDVPVTDLRAGDLIETLDRGPQAIAWISHVTTVGVGLGAPVTIEAGVLGNDLPLIVSQSQRLLIDDGAADLLFGAQEVLIEARDLISLPGVAITPTPSLTYTYILMGDHEVVFANGMPAETLFLDDDSLACLDAPVRAALAPMCNGFRETAAPCLTSDEASVWCQYARAA